MTGRMGDQEVRLGIGAERARAAEASRADATLALKLVKDLLAKSDALADALADAIARAEKAEAEAELLRQSVARLGSRPFLPATTGPRDHQ